MRLLSAAILDKKNDLENFAPVFLTARYEKLAHGQKIPNKKRPPEKNSDSLHLLGARSRTRTCTLLPTLVPETSASTNFAIRAYHHVKIVYPIVPRTRLELARPCGHYPLKVACLPISPPGQNVVQNYKKSFSNSRKKNNLCPN